MIRRPPKSTPLPYTTLFRSRLARRPGRRNGAHDAARLDDVLEGVERHLLARELLGHVGDDEGVDRKSTRLNSSHANISYAVFCLKKKKTNYSTTHSCYLNYR